MILINLCSCDMLGRKGGFESFLLRLHVRAAFSGPKVRPPGPKALSLEPSEAPERSREAGLVHPEGW